MQKFKEDYFDWEKSVESVFLEDMSKEDKDLAFLNRQTLNILSEKKEPETYDLKDALRKLHYLFFRKDVNSTPTIHLNKPRAVFKPSYYLEMCEVWLDSLKPNIVLEEFFHYSLYYEWHTSNTVTPSNYALFVSRDSRFIHHMIIAPLVKIITPELYDDFFNIKNERFISKFGSVSPPTLSQSRQLAEDLINLR